MKATTTQQAAALSESRVAWTYHVIALNAFAADGDSWYRSVSGRQHLHINVSG